jgi:hypothetical protein
MSEDNAAEAARSPHEQGLAQLLGQLFRDAETLLLQELALVRAEIGESAGNAIGGALLALVGVVVSLVGGLAIVAAIILLLGKLLPLWLSSALVGIAALAVGGGLIFWGKRRLARASVVPRQSWQALRETGDWLREELT